MKDLAMPSPIPEWSRSQSGWWSRTDHWVAIEVVHDADSWRSSGMGY